MTESFKQMYFYLVTMTDILPLGNSYLNLANGCVNELMAS